MPSFRKMLIRHMFPPFTVHCMSKKGIKWEIKKNFNIDCTLR